MEQPSVGEHDEALMEMQARIQIGEEARHESLSGHKSLLSVQEEAFWRGGCR